MGRRRVSRREALRWGLLAGGAGTVALLGPACGGLFGGSGNSTPSPTGTTPTPTPGPSYAPCDCATVTGAPTPFKRADISAGKVVYDSSRSIFVCQDASGIYALSSICTHAGCDIAASGGCGGVNYSPANLSAGFCCGCHGAQFDGNGVVTVGPGGLPKSSITPLNHLRTSIAADTTIWVETNPPFVDPTCRCT